MNNQSRYKALLAMRDQLGNDPRSRRIKTLIDRTIQLGIRFSVLAERLRAFEAEHPRSLPRL